MVVEQSLELNLNNVRNVKEQAKYSTYGLQVLPDLSKSQHVMHVEGKEGLLKLNVKVVAGAALYIKLER
jgi:hypothetical protein